MFCEEMKAELGSEGESWGLLGGLFEGKRERLVEAMGFDKEELVKKVEVLVGKLVEVAREPLVGEGEEEGGESSEGGDEGEGRNGGSSISGISTKREAETEVTEPSLFGDDTLILPTISSTSTSTQSQAALDFYSQIGSGRSNVLPDHLFGAGGPNSSVAATAGSASSVASLKPSTPFRIHPSDQSELDRLLTRALVMGDFESAVELALASDRFADAILLASRGGAELLAKTQKIYFEKEAGKLPYLRVFKSIVGEDLLDLVLNAELEEWEEVFVVVTTFAQGDDEFGRLIERLGIRLEEMFEVVKKEKGLEAAKSRRKNATLCYLAAGKLEKVVGIWIGQMIEEENEEEKGKQNLAKVKFEAHSKALQGFVEKVTVFQHAVNYVDVDLTSPIDPTSTSPRKYKLAALYDRYVEYAELLASQGLVNVALKFIAQTPVDFESETTEPALTRHRIESAAGKSSVGYGGRSQIPSLPSTIPTVSIAPPHQPLQPLQQQGQGYSYPTPEAYGRRYEQQPPAAQSRYSNGNTSSSPSYLPPVAPPTNDHDDPYAPYAAKQNSQPSPYAPPNYQGQQQPTFQPPPQLSPYTANVAPYQSSQSFVPAPPAIRETSPNFVSRTQANPAPPPPRAKPEGHWNDPPPMQVRKTTPMAPPPPKPITSPFPVGPGGQQQQPQYGAPPPQGQGYGGQQQQQPPPPPPSRGSNRTPAPVQPPPPSRFQPPPPIPTLSPPPPAGFQGQQQQRFPPPPPPPGPPRSQQQQQPGAPYPPHVANSNFRGAPTPPPNSAGGFARPPQPLAPSPYGPPPGQQPQQQQGPPPPSPYGPPPGQQQQGPPQQQQRLNGPPAPYANNGAPPPAPGPHGPPPTANPQQSGPYGPPAGSQQRPGPPPSFNNGVSRPSQSSPAPTPVPAPAPARPEPSKAKYC